MANCRSSFHNQRGLIFHRKQALSLRLTLCSNATNDRGGLLHCLILRGESTDAEMSRTLQTYARLKDVQPAAAARIGQIVAMNTYMHGRTDENVEPPVHTRLLSIHGHGHKAPTGSLYFCLAPACIAWNLSYRLSLSLHFQPPGVLSFLLLPSQTSVINPQHSPLYQPSSCILPSISLGFSS